MLYSCTWFCCNTPLLVPHQCPLFLFSASSAARPGVWGASPHDEGDRVIQPLQTQEAPVGFPCPTGKCNYAHKGFSERKGLKRHLVSTMPPRNRSRGRDVHIFNTRDPNTLTSGLILTNGVTTANLHTMIEIFVIFSDEYVLRNKSNVTNKEG
jgi:hypothetical protein